MPCRLHLLPAPLHVPRRTFHEYVVIHLIDTRRKLLSGPVEHRIKRLALVALEVFVRGPIVRLESVEVGTPRSEEHTSELQSPCNLVCRLLLEKKKHYHVRRETRRHRLRNLREKPGQSPQGISLWELE